MTRRFRILFLFFLCSSFIASDKSPIRWRFDQFKKLSFEYVQTATSQFGMMGEDKPMNQRMTGQLILRVKGADLADMVLTNAKTEMYTVGEKGDTSIVMSMPMPETFLQNMRQDGTVNGSTGQGMEMIARVLFPVMNKDAAIGDSVDLPMSIPFNMFGSVIDVSGYNRVRYTAHTNGLEKLETVINVSEFTVPEDVKTKYNCSLTGNSSFDFNAQKGYFTGGFAHLRMIVGTGKSDSTAVLSGMNMSMDTRIAIRLLSVE